MSPDPDLAKAAEKPEARFERELEIFRKESNEAVQHLYAYLTMRAVAGENKSVVDLYNSNPLFWLTTHHALLTSVFIVLGRIFTLDSEHNLNALLRVAMEEQAIFSRESLARRKSEIPNLDVAQYVRDAYVPTAVDFRGLRRQAGEWRRIYEENYRTVRNQVFAHTEISREEEVSALFSKTNIQELELMVIDLVLLHCRLQGLLQNGSKLSATRAVSSVQQLRSEKSNSTLQGRVTLDTERALLSAADAYAKAKNSRGL